MFGTVHALLPIVTGIALIDTPELPAPGDEGWRELFVVDIAAGKLGDSPIPAPDGATTYSITYKGQIAGLNVGRIFIDVATSPRAYQVDYKMEQHGIARWFSDAEATTTARGTYDGEGHIDGQYYYNHDYERDDDQQYVEMFRAPGKSRISLWANPIYTFHEPVTEEMAKEALDPMAALLALSFAPVAEGQSPCDRFVEVFDGRRLFELIMIDDGTEYIRKGGKGRFEGKAYKCKLEQEKVAGYREKDKGDIDGDLWVYLTEVPEDFRHETFAYVPVMIKAKQGLLGARLEGKNPIITAPDGRTVNLGADKK